MKAHFCMDILRSHMVFLTLLACFVSNPLILRWIYYTAESICDGMEAIKGFIYPYLERISKKLPCIIQSGTQSTGGAPPGWILFLDPFIKKSYSVSLFIAGYCHRFKGGKHLLWAGGANGGAAAPNKRSFRSVNQISSLAVKYRKAILERFHKGICFCAFIDHRRPPQMVLTVELRRTNCCGTLHSYHCQICWR